MSWVGSLAQELIHSMGVAKKKTIKEKETTYEHMSRGAGRIRENKGKKRQLSLNISNQQDNGY